MHHNTMIMLFSTPTVHLNLVSFRKFSEEYGLISYTFRNRLWSFWTDYMIDSLDGWLWLIVRNRLWLIWPLDNQLRILYFNSSSKVSCLKNYYVLTYWKILHIPFKTFIPPPLFFVYSRDITLIDLNSLFGKTTLLRNELKIVGRPENCLILSPLNFRKCVTMVFN